MKQLADLQKTRKREAKLLFNGVFECYHVLGGIALGGVSVFGCDKFSERTEAFCSAPEGLNCFHQLPNVSLHAVKSTAQSKLSLSFNRSAYNSGKLAKRTTARQSVPIFFFNKYLISIFAHISSLSHSIPLKCMGISPLCNILHFKGHFGTIYG